MRFLRVRIHRFGPLVEVDTGPDPLPGLTVVLGPNEAGKSSFFMALRALLYGIYPTRPELNPYAPWDGAEIDLEADVEGEEGRVGTVHRRLLSSPWGRLRAEGGEEVDLRNETLPWASHVPREIYRELFSITLPELVHLQGGRGWEEVRDRLLAGMGTGDLAAPRRVVESLEADAVRLWRPDRRGRSRHREVEEALTALSDRLSRARERDALLRRRHRRLGAVEEELDRRREVLTGVQTTLERLRVLIPLRTRLRRMEERRVRAGDPTLLEGLPGDPVERLQALVVQVREVEGELEAARTRLAETEGTIPEEDPVDRRLLSRRDRAWALTLESEVVRDWQGRRASAAARLDAVDEEVRRVGAELFGEPDEPVPARAVLQLSTSELADRIRDREEGERRRAEAEERLLAARARPLPPEAPSRPTGSVMALAVAGILLLLVGAVLLLGPVEGLGAAAVVALLAGAVVSGQAVLARIGWARERDRIRGERQDREQEQHALESREAELAERVREVEAGMDTLLEELPLRAERRERPREGLVQELVRLQDLFRRRESAHVELRELDRGLHETGERLARLLREVEGLDLPDDPVRALPLLAERLEEADGRARSRQDALREADRAREEIQRLEGELAVRQGELAAFRERLLRIQPGTGTEEAAQEGAVRLAALGDALRLQGELEEEAGELDDLRRRIAALEEELVGADPGPAPSEPEVIRVGLEAEAEEIRRELEELREEAGDLRAEIRALSEEETVDVVEAAVAELREERATLRRERDRLWILARVVRVAERRYRDAHQPELTRRASRYLERFTGGRYSRLLLGDDGDPDALLLQAAHLPGSQPVTEPLSTGTREQVFLALRLAVVDQMDREGARLPLALDETLVNWDDERRLRGLDLLDEVARERQVLLFTCHPGLAREAAERGARLVELPGPA
jgi:DNA repair exonuclease SbcCD ATPase subunit